MLHRPTLFALFDLREILPYVPKIGTPAFRRFMLGFIPRPAMRKMIWIVDMLWDTAKQIFYNKKAALERGEDAVVHQVGEGKDIISILRMSYFLLPRFLWINKCLK